MSRRFWCVVSLVGLFSLGCDTDNEADNKAGFLVFPETQSVVSQYGGSSDFILQLSSAPAFPVTIQVQPGETGIIELSQDEFTVSAQDWNVARTLSVRCLLKNTQTSSTVFIKFTTSSLDPDYQQNVQLRSIVCPGSNSPVVVNPDNPQPVNPEDNPLPSSQTVEHGAILITNGSGLEVSESGKTAQFGIALSQPPVNGVMVAVRSLDEAEGRVFPQTLFFSAADFMTPQFVTVSGVDDDILDGDKAFQVEISALSTDDAYADVNSILLNVVNIDDEQVPLVPDGTPGVLVSPVGGLETTEKGGTASFDVVLKGQPMSSVTIPVASSDTTEGTTDISQLVFMPENWNQKQTVHISGVDDTDSDGNVSYSIKLGPAVSDDPRYQNLPVTSVLVKNIDNDPPNIPASFKVSSSTLSIEESGAPGKFTIAPGTAPMEAMTIRMTVSDDTEGTVSPDILVFDEKTWQTPQTVLVSGKVDGIEDGTQTFYVNFEITGGDSRFEGYKLAPVQVKCADSDKHTGTSVQLRIMAANITSGNNQSYSPGHGVRIFKAVQPDVVLIQEFNWNGANDTNEQLEPFVASTFGDEFSFYRGRGAIPNGIISRFPILDSGYWDSNVVNNRHWDWAVVDLPGPKELLAVSVHLHTDDNALEMPVLIQKIQEKMAQDATKGLSYFVVVGGDFNTKSRADVIARMSSVFTTTAPYPVDQKGNDATNLTRNSPYDYVLCSPDWCRFEIPVEIGAHTGTQAYANGHVFDSRVYAKTKMGSTSELTYVSPVEADDSSAANMQHMPVIRDFKYTY